MSVPVHKLAYAPGYDVEPIAIVGDSTNICPNIITGWFSSWRDVFGGRSGIWSEHANKASDYLQQSLAAQAAALGANAVLAYEQHPVGGIHGGRMEGLIAYGQAVRLIPKGAR